MLKAVIFDIDGTLVDSVEAHARSWQQTLEKYGKKIELEEIRKMIGMGSDQMLPEIFSAEQLERYGKEIDEYKGSLFKREYLSHIRPFPRVRELLLRIHKDDRKISLASS